jgi:5-methylcytosine-specific restriction enzyme subunit McrC
VKQPITVHEYARLTTVDVQSTLDEARISSSAFQSVCQLSVNLSKQGAALVKIESLQRVRLDNYIGVIETPCGTRIEILPKIFGADDDVNRTRELLVRMLERALDLPTREVGPAILHTFKGPLTEWLASRFLLALDRLVRSGVRFIYHRIEDEQRFLRGRLDLPRQLRRPPGRQHVFDLQHDVFDPDRSENRLLRSALDRVCYVTKDPSNWRIARELDSYLSPIPPSQNIHQDFRQWQHDRLMTHYDRVKPWCSLILNEQLPMTVSGQWYGPSLLYPMDKLFERYVRDCLRRSLGGTAKVVPQASREHLCCHNKKSWFELRPDLLITRRGQSWILDTKWKLLDQALKTTEDKYKISQDDMYQMFAYGQRYLNGKGEMALIYPKTKQFSRALPPFEFSKELKLWAIAFDIEKGTFVEEGLPDSLKPVLGLESWAIA